MKKTITFCLLTAWWATGMAQTTTLAIPDAQTMAGSWTVIDANGDGGDNQWTYYDQSAHYVQNKSKAADDWLISPGIALEAGKTYQISASVKMESTYSSDKQRFAITAGTGVTVADQSTELYKNESFQNKYYTTVSGTFSPTTNGTYYLGIHCYSASYMGDLVFEKFEVAEQVVYPGAVPYAVTGPQPPGGILAVDITFTWPTVTNVGTPLTDLQGAKIYRSMDDNFTISDDLLMGDVAYNEGDLGGSFSEDVQAPGYYYYAFIPYNANGPSPETPHYFRTDWVGPDTYTNVSNVVATAYAGRKYVYLTWTDPHAEHGGYVDFNNLAYRVMRTFNGGEQHEVADPTHIDSVTGEYPDVSNYQFVDFTPDALGSYQYYVTAYLSDEPIDEHASQAVSNAVIAGTQGLSIPYTPDFRSDDTDLLSFIYADDCTRQWTHNTSTGYLEFWGGGNADTWVVTPPLHLEAGKAYQIDYDAWLERSTYPKNLTVAWGAAGTADALTNELFNGVIDTQYQGSGKHSHIITVNADGDYYIGWHHTGPTNSYGLRLAGFSVTETVFTPEVPALQALPGADGALTAQISVTAPSQTTAGTTIDALEAIDVMRDGQTVHTFDNPTPGVQLSWEDVLAQAGEYTYTAKAVMNGNASEATTAPAIWVGADTPCAPANAQAAVDAQGNALVTYDAVTAGVHGGYVDADAVRYRIVRMPEAVTVANDYEQTSFVDIAGNLTLGVYSYQITATAGDLTSEAATTDKVTLGAALSLPYSPDFNDAETFDLWITPADATAHWSYDSSNKALSAYSSSAYIFTPPFEAEGEHYYLAEITGKNYNWRNEEDLDVYLAAAPTTDATQMTKIGSMHLDSTMGVDSVFRFKIPTEGRWHLGFNTPTANMYAYITKANVRHDPTDAVVDLNVDCASASYNAATSMLNVPADAKSVIVSNIAGMQVVVAKDADAPVDLSQLPAGVYIVAIVKADGTCQSLKIAK